jgi:hypothetical protein
VTGLPRVSPGRGCHTALSPLSTCSEADRLVWLFQLTSVPCDEVGFVPPGQPIPPPDRDGCDEYRLFDARSGAEVGGGFITLAGAAVLRPP